MYAALGDEMLWNESMPGLLPAGDQIPIADYGTSNIGQLKMVYRRGLAYRYGRTMQCIAGIHYNYWLDDEVWRRLHAEEGSTASMVDYQSERYLALIRNFRRTSWLLMYLFGASPALDARFLRDRAHTLETFDADTLYRPYATSLRMSDLGYSNTTAQAALEIDYNTLPGYLDALSKAVSEPYPAYEAIGTHRDGEWIQINTNVLQIENEFYSTIRPKRVTYSGERPLHALASRGVQYIEVALPRHRPVRTDRHRARHRALHGCVPARMRVDDSAPLTCDAYREANANFGLVTLEGRRPGLALTREGVEIPLRAWAEEMLDKIEAAARVLDEIRGDTVHRRTVAAQRDKLADPERTPSARVLRAMRDAGQSFLTFARTRSEAHAEAFRARPLDAAAMRTAQALAEQSLAEQADSKARMPARSMRSWPRTALIR